MLDPALQITCEYNFWDLGNIIVRMWMGWCCQRPTVPIGIPVWFTAERPRDGASMGVKAKGRNGSAWD